MAAGDTITADRDGTDEEPPPPPPPSRDEALAVCPQLPTPRIGRNPDPRGLTGLETWLWAEEHEQQEAEEHEQQEADGEVRGYEVSCVATPVQWTWTTDGKSYRRNRGGGPAPDHAAEHMYERKGMHEISLTVAWRLQTDYGEALRTVTTTEPYQVIEIISVAVERW